MSRRFAVLATALVLAACGHGETPHDHGGSAAHEEPGHVHTAPHGGTLVVLAEEAAHAEIVLDAESGRLTLYLLGAHADTPLRLAAPTIEIEIVPSPGAPSERVELAAQASELTGETVGDSSEFAADVPSLRGSTAFAGWIESVEVVGTKFTRVAFSYPR